MRRMVKRVMEWSSLWSYETGDANSARALAEVSRNRRGSYVILRGLFLNTP
jgi:hypothetical protein